METRKRTQQTNWTITKNVETGPQNGSPDAVIFWSSGSFFLCQTALGAQMAPKPPPRARETSPSLDFHRFWIDFGRSFEDIFYQVGYFLSGLPHYFLVTSSFHFQISGHKFKCVGVVRRGQWGHKKSAMWPTFCLACLFVFVTSSPTFQVSGHGFFGVVSAVKSSL